MGRHWSQHRLPLKQATYKLHFLFPGHQPAGGIKRTEGGIVKYQQDYGFQ
jgi:hypothetical protein